MVTTRFAPSPTGKMHIGGLRNALYSFLWAKKNKGKFILRIEDTDKSREIAGAKEEIQKLLKAFGLEYNEMHIQSERLEKYKSCAQQLVNKGSAYYCFCNAKRLNQVRQQQIKNSQPPMYDKHCRSLSQAEVQSQLKAKKPYVIRLKVPDNQTIKFNDLVRGEIQTESQTIDDQVLLKSDGYPTYHLAVVVDDYEMRISHIIRGQEWLPSTPKHILLYQAFGWNLPIFAHTNNIVDAKGRKLSKRFGDVSVESFLQQGYLPAAILNLIALLGWNPGGDQEIMSLDQMIEKFKLEELNKSSAFFDFQKLNWFNHEYLRTLPASDFDNYCQSQLPKDLQITEALRQLLKERIDKLNDIKSELFFLKDNDYDSQLLVYKKSTLEAAKENLINIKKLLDKYQGDFTQDKLRDYFTNYIKQNNLKTGNFLWPFRIALAGQKDSPDVFEMAKILGPEKIKYKIDYAIKLLEK